MVMIMTATTKKMPDPLILPMMPARETYRDGMNKLRAQIDCPVLSLEEDDIADELRDYDWEVQSASPAAKIPKRPTVSDYLKKQYQANMLARYPNFEATTENDIAKLKLQVDQMYVFNMVIVVLLGLLLALGVWLIFLMA